MADRMVRVETSWLAQQGWCAVFDGETGCDRPRGHVGPHRFHDPSGSGAWTAKDHFGGELARSDGRGDESLFAMPVELSSLATGPLPDSDGDCAPCSQRDAHERHQWVLEYDEGPHAGRMRLLWCLGARRVSLKPVTVEAVAALRERHSEPDVVTAATRRALGAPGAWPLCKQTAEPLAGGGPDLVCARVEGHPGAHTTIDGTSFEVRRCDDPECQLAGGHAGPHWRRSGAGASDRTWSDDESEQPAACGAVLESVTRGGGPVVCELFASHSGSHRSCGFEWPVAAGEHDDVSPFDRVYRAYELLDECASALRESHRCRPDAVEVLRAEAVDLAAQVAAELDAAVGRATMHAHAVEVPCYPACPRWGYVNERRVVPEPPARLLAAGSLLHDADSGELLGMMTTPEVAQMIAAEFNEGR